MTSWAAPDMKNCKQLVTMSDLFNITVTTGKSVTHRLVHCLCLYTKIINCNNRRSSTIKVIYGFVDNAAEVVDIVQDLVDVQLSNSSELSSLELDSVVEKLNEVVDISVIKPAVGADIITVIAVILLSETNVTPVSTT